MALKIDAKFEEKLIFFTKMTRIWWNLTWALASLQTCTFICSYCAKYLMSDLEKYRGVIFHDTEGWCKIRRKTDLWLAKWHEEYGKFSPEHLKLSKLGFWCDPLIQSRKSMSLNSEISYVSWQWRMMQSLKRNWLVISKLTWEIWWILTRALESLRNFHFNVFLLSKVYELRKYRGFIFHETEEG